MELIINIVASVIFGLLAIYCFAVTVKKYKEDDEGILDILSYDVTILYILHLFFGGILFLLKKILPFTLYLIVFKLLSFAIGLLMIYLIYIFWTTPLLSFLE